MPRAGCHAARRHRVQLGRSHSVPSQLDPSGLIRLEYALTVRTRRGKLAMSVEAGSAVNAVSRSQEKGHWVDRVRVNYRACHPSS
jgi:hypothetical protein